MANNNAAPNVWTQMNYVPPRGQCNFKPSIMSAKCPCLRFMLHPLKSSSSYECDGCTHHASFHSMENKAEDEIRKKWELEAKEKAEQEERVLARPRKRLRELEYHNGDTGTSNIRLLENGIVTPDDTDDQEIRSMPAAGSSNGRARARAKTNKARGKATATRSVATRTRGKVTEILDEESEEIAIELD